MQVDILKNHFFYFIISFPNGSFFSTASSNNFALNAPRAFKFLLKYASTLEIHPLPVEG